MHTKTHSTTWVLYLSLFLFILTGGCAQDGVNVDQEQVRQNLDAALNNVVADESGHVYRNAGIYIEIPHQNFTYVNAAGIARADGSEARTVDHQFPTASVAKTTIAVIIMQLWEEGAFGEDGLDVTLADLEIFPPDVIEALHRIDGISYGQAITVRHLLSHTSGLRNVFKDSQQGLGEEYPAFNNKAPGSLGYMANFDGEKGFDAMLHCQEDGLPADCKPTDYYLGYIWAHWDYAAWVKDPDDKMAGLLNYYLSGMNEAALWEPGKGYHYSDTNYLILGLLIEKLTGNSLHHELRTRIFDPLGMDHTYLAGATDPPAASYEGRFADHWRYGYPHLNSVDLSHFWAGGGQVSTLEDLNTYIRALAHGELFKYETTLAEMTKIPEGVDNTNCALGIFVWPDKNGVILYHLGANGSWIEYHTGYDLSFVGNTNEWENLIRFYALRAGVYKALQDTGIKSSTFKTVPIGYNLIQLMEGRITPTHPLVPVFSYLMYVIALIGWPLSAVVARRKGQEPVMTARLARWLAVAVIIIDLVFVATLYMSLSSNMTQLQVGFTTFSRGVLLLPWLSAVLTIGVLVCTVLVWKNRYWHISWRVHYALVTLAALANLWSRSELSLLIFP